MQLMRWIHLVGLALFVGGGLAAGIANRLATGGGPDASGLDRADAALSRFADGGVLLLFLSGIGAIFMAGIAPGALLRQGWLITMIVLGVAAAGLNGVAGKRARLLATTRPDEPTARAARALIVKLRLAFLLATLGAITAGIWRF